MACSLSLLAKLLSSLPDTRIPLFHSEMIFSDVSSGMSLCNYLQANSSLSNVPVRMLWTRLPVSHPLSITRSPVTETTYTAHRALPLVQAIDLIEMRA